MAIEVTCYDSVVIFCFSQVGWIIVVGWGIVNVVEVVFLPRVPHFSLLDVSVVDAGGGDIACDVISDKGDNSLAVLTLALIGSVVGHAEICAGMLRFLEECHVYRVLV